MSYRRLSRNQTRSFKSHHRRRAFRHHACKPNWMRTNDREAARETRALALDAIRIKERAVVIRTLIDFCFLLHDSNVGARNAELSFSVIVSNSFQQSLPGAERQRNQAMKDDRVSDRQRQDD